LYSPNPIPSPTCPDGGRERDGGTFVKIEVAK
jgi:hypothetical protein